MIHFVPSETYNLNLDNNLIENRVGELHILLQLKQILVLILYCRSNWCWSFWVDWHQSNSTCKLIRASDMSPLMLAHHY